MRRATERPWVHVRPQGGVGRQLRHLGCVVVARLGRWAGEGVLSTARRVVARALVAAGQRFRAAVRLAGWLDPQIRVDQLRQRGGHGRRVARAGAADIAPRAALVARVALPVARGVDDDVRLEAGARLAVSRPLGQGLGVDQLGQAAVPLPQQTAGVLTALMPTPGTPAVVDDPRVAPDLVGRAWRRPERVVVGDVDREATQLRCHAGQVTHELREVSGVVVPPQPAAVGGVEVQRGVRRGGGEDADGLGDARRVGRAGRGAAVGILRVGDEVWQAIRLENHNHRHGAVRGQLVGQRRHVVGQVVGDSLVAVARRGTVALAVVVDRAAAELAVARRRVAVSVGQVVHHDLHERRPGLRGGVG